MIDTLHILKIRLCYVLFVNKNTEYSTHLWKFRENARDEDRMKESRSRFLYIYANVQKDFVKSFDQGLDNYATPCADKSLPLKVSLIVLCCCFLFGVSFSFIKKNKKYLKQQTANVDL